MPEVLLCAYGGLKLYPDEMDENRKKETPHPNSNQEKELEKKDLHLRGPSPTSGEYHIYPWPSETKKMNLKDGGQQKRTATTLSLIKSGEGKGNGEL